MPNPRKPSHLKAISGTNRKDRMVAQVVEFPLATSVPAAPAWLSKDENAIAEWNRLAPILHANKLLTTAGASALGVLCALHGKIVAKFSEGEAPTGHMIAQYRNLINDFGLTPVAQSKVKHSGGEAKPGNRFAANGKRPA